MRSVGTCPTTVLLFAMSECVSECCTERLNDKEVLPCMRWWTCMLPRELIWEGVAPPQENGMTQYAKGGLCRNKVVKHPHNGNISWSAI